MHKSSVPFNFRSENCCKKIWKEKRNTCFWRLCNNSVPTSIPAHRYNRILNQLRSLARIKQNLLSWSDMSWACSMHSVRQMHPAPYVVGTGALSPGVNGLRCHVNHLPPSSEPKLKDRQELYLQQKPEGSTSAVIKNPLWALTCVKYVPQEKYLRTLNDCIGFPTSWVLSGCNLADASSVNRRHLLERRLDERRQAVHM